MSISQPLLLYKSLKQISHELPDSSFSPAELTSDLVSYITTLHDCFGTESSINFSQRLLSSSVPLSDFYSVVFDILLHIHSLDNTILSPFDSSDLCHVFSSLAQFSDQINTSKYNSLLSSLFHLTSDVRQGLNLPPSTQKLVDSLFAVAGESNEEESVDFDLIKLRLEKVESSLEDLLCFDKMTRPNYDRLSSQILTHYLNNFELFDNDFIKCRLFFTLLKMFKFLLQTNTPLAHPLFDSLKRILQQLMQNSIESAIFQNVYNSNIQQILNFCIMKLLKSKTSSLPLIFSNFLTILFQSNVVFPPLFFPTLFNFFRVFQIQNSALISLLMSSNDHSLASSQEQKSLKVSTLMDVLSFLNFSNNVQILEKCNELVGLISRNPEAINDSLFASTYLFQKILIFILQNLSTEELFSIDVDVFLKFENLNSYLKINFLLYMCYKNSLKFPFVHFSNFSLFLTF
ncbi:hypothetical protein GEMRC1_005111 [Eukaryota sp. GEM-RC1]